MKKMYEFPEVEVIYTDLSNGLLQVIISGGGGIEDDETMPYDEDYDD